MVATAFPELSALALFGLGEAESRVALVVINALSAVVQGSFDALSCRAELLSNLSKDLALVFVISPLVNWGELKVAVDPSKCFLVDVAQH
jgi:hypothetical protein